MTFEVLDNLNGKVAVITGGVGQMGYATARRLAKEGAQIVAIVRRDLENAQSMLDQLPNSGHYAILADITDTPALIEAAKTVRERSGRCDILVNAAGISNIINPGQVKQLTDELFDKILINNTRGTFAVIREFYDLLMETGDALIVNITSTAGLKGSRSNLAYGASKAGIDLMTKSLAKFLSPKVRVVSVAPAYMNRATSGITKRPGVNDELAKMIPLGRVGEGEDVAGTIYSLALNMRFVTGSVIVADGGASL